jgi:NADPH:quinone reductase
MELQNMSHAIIIKRFGSSNVQTYSEVEISDPGPGMARIKQEAIGVNYLDIYLRRGESLPNLALPAINGYEGAGVIEKLGSGVEGFKVGQRVAYTLALGAYTSHRLISVARLVTLPIDVSTEDAAALMLKGTSAEYLVERVVSIGSGDTVLVHAAAGGLGSLIAQWASYKGARVIGTVGDASKIDVALASGCERVVVRDGDQNGFIEAVKDFTGAKGLKVMYDGVAGTSFSTSLGLLGERGTAVVLGTAGGQAPPLNVHSLKAKSLSVISPSLAHYTSITVEYQRSANALFRMLQSGVIKTIHRHRYSLRDAAQAHYDLEARKTSGSIVLLPE